MIRYLIIIDGRVQGVGFRYFTQLEASKLKLTGWVKNLVDDRVEIEIQGLEENVYTFISLLKKGNNFSRVDDVSLTSIPVVYDEKKYKIMY